MMSVEIGDRRSEIGDSGSPEPLTLSGVSGYVAAEPWFLPDLRSPISDLD